MEKLIELPYYEIILHLNKDDNTPEGRWSGGNLVHSKTKDECPYCGQYDCYHHCDESQAGGFEECLETDDEWTERYRWNTAMDVLESMILAHAIAGIDVESPAYAEGIETAVEVLSNKSF